MKKGKKVKSGHWCYILLSTTTEVHYQDQSFDILCGSEGINVQ